MDSPGERQASAELLAATRELVAANREIARSLTSVERLYAKQVARNAEQRDRLAALTARLGKPPSGWAFYLVTLIIPAAMIALFFLK